MLDFLPLAIFPAGALDSSVVTTVWVGIFVVAFLNLRLGWVLSGLVVPGYLVPLLLLKPSAAAVVLAEGLVTYGIVWFYSEWLSERAGWSNFFGRDRFFALVLTSVGVRVIGDGWLLPQVGEWMVNTWQLQFDYRNNLHSFGLIIVSLIANNFWKTGFRRGVFPLLMTLGISYVIVRFVLMELTNFSVANIGYLYEDMASSILSSPKAYIILLTTAFVASRMNLFYGWDFSGILIPSLLALQWYQPQKILMSFVEALIILGLAMLVLRLPYLQRITVEGARKVLLFFNISFLYKMVLAYALLWFWPDVKITDYYGFGYLLPTLIAMKMHDKEIVGRMSRAILQTSMVSALIATLVGFSLSLLPDPWRWLVDEPTVVGSLKPIVAETTIIDQLRRDKVDLYRTRSRGEFIKPTPREEEAFGAALRRLAAFRDAPDDAEMRRIVGLLDIANYQLELHEGRYYMLREKDARKYWGTYIVNPVATNDLVIEVPAPMDERGAMDAGIWLFRYLDARAFAMAGSARRVNKDGSSDVLANPNTPYQMFHRNFARRNVLQVRTYTPETARLLGGERRDARSLEVAPPQSTLRAKGDLPESLSLQAIKNLIGDFDIAWEPVPLPNLQRDSVGSGFVEAVFNRDDVRKILARGIASEQNIRNEAFDRSIDGYLQDWLQADRQRIAAAGSDLYRPPHTEDLLYFDDEILTPLLAAGRLHYGPDGWTDTGLEELKLINIAAKVIGYEIIRYRHRSSGTDYLILGESDAAPRRRYWGTYVFRLGRAESYMVQAPRPLFEVNSFEFAVSLFERLRAGALLIGGAHPDANRDHSADIVKFANKENVFNLVNQVLIREAGDAPLMAVQTRALGNRPDSPLPAADLLLSFASGLDDPQRGSALAQQLAATLSRSGHSFAIARGSVEAAGYEASGIPQTLYLNASRNKEFAAAWITPLARADYRQQTEPTPQALQFAALHISSSEGDLRQLLASRASPAKLPNGLQAQVDNYVRRQDIVLLSQIVTAWPRLRFERVVDLNSGRGYLLIRDAEQRWLAVTKLAARASGAESSPPGLRAEGISGFMDGSAHWLLAAETKP